MIVEIKAEFLASPLLERLCARYKTEPRHIDNATLVITAGTVRELDPEFSALSARVHVTQGDVQLADLKWHPKRTVNVAGVEFGGSNTPMIAGPCSVESPDQIMQVAAALKGMGVKLLRAGAFKPRTSPYCFQGLGREGLLLLRQVCDEYRMGLVTEVRDATHLDWVIETADLVQIGAKAMYDHGILRGVGLSQKPVLLKRGFGATLKEFVQAAEFLLSYGNPNVMLCERGIRTFETQTRFTLDLCGVAYLKQHVNLPILVDPSHAMGYAYGVADLARAAMAMGIDGLLIEVHPKPSEALSDAAQQLDLQEFTTLYDSLRPIARAIGREFV